MAKRKKQMWEKEGNKKGKQSQRQKAYIRKAAVLFFTALLLQTSALFMSFAAKAELPKIRIRWNGTGQDDYWYKGGEDKFEFTVTAEGGGTGELAASIYCGTEEEKIEEVSDKKENVPMKKGQISFGKWVYNREGGMEQGDQEKSYVVIVKDQAGNVVKSEAVQVRIDETAPEMKISGGHPAVFYQFANAAHEKIAGKDCVQENQLGGYLFQGTLLSRTAVVVTVDVRDGLVRPDGDKEEPLGTETKEEKLSGSGIEKVVLKADGEVFEPVEKPKGKTGEGSYRFQFPFCPGKETEYHPEMLELTDRAGNRAVYRFGSEPALESIVVDGKIPEVDFLDEVYTARNRKGALEWYSALAQGQGLRITANARDRYGIYAVEWYMTDEDGNVTQGPLTADQPGKMAAVPEQGHGAFGRPVLSGTAVFRLPQTQLYAVRAIDWAGNATGFIRARDISENRGSLVNIDNQPAVITETGGMADVAYCFSNVKYREKDAVRDQELTDQAHLVNGRLVSGTDVRVTVAAEDFPEVLGTKASGVKEVALVTSGGEHQFSLPDDAKDSCRLTLAGAKGEETVYECKCIRITDNAGNVNIYPYTEEGLGSLTIVVDKKNPVRPEEGVFRTTAGENHIRAAEGDGLTGWYSAADGTGKTICAAIKDDCGISCIRWFAFKGEADSRNQPEDSLLVSETKNPDEKAVSFSHSETFFQDQDQLYGVEAVDWAGNRAVFWADEPGNRGSRVRIDNGAPQETVLIQWENDGENRGENDYEQPKPRYQMPGNGAVFGKDHVVLKLYVRDELREGLRQAEKDKISSGIRKLSVTVNHDGKKEVMVRSNGLQTRRAEIEGKEYLEFVFDLDWSIPEKTETEKWIENILIYDGAGNVAPASAQPFGDGVRYILDNCPPKLEVDYHPGNYVEHEGYPDTYFYRDAKNVDVSIRERYFFPEDDSRMRIDCQADGAAEMLERSPWEGDGEEYRSVFSMPKDGSYRFFIGYTDRSGNRMEGKEVTEGRFSSKYLVLDTKKPVIEVAFLYNGSDITEEITKKKYFGGSVTAEVTVTEANFDPALAELKAWGYSGEDRKTMSAEWDGPWKDAGEDVHKNTVTFAAQGTWQFACVVKDIVGWEEKTPAVVEFVIDTMPPSVEISFDRNDPEHEAFYQEARTALIRVKDRSFHPEDAKVFLTASGPRPAEGEWRHMPGRGCTGEEQGHVDSCAYELRMAFTEDGDYTLAFQCADRAGNRSEREEAAPFTIDRTPPKVTVAYDNMNVSHGMYYNRQRRAEITVEEHNFQPEDVTVTITAGRVGEAAVLPSVSEWTSVSDRHSASVLFDYDGEFTFHIACKDLAGNQSETEPEDHFIIDLTPPELEIMGVRNKSANNQEVAPGIRYSDANPDPQRIVLELTGAENGAVSLENQRTPVPSGQMIQYEDFPRNRETDDLYTLHVSAADLAGNISEETVAFSVNRFGSSYLFDSKTQEALDRYYLDRPVAIQVTEINVDTLEFREITCGRDGEIRLLRQGEDYEVSRSGGEGGWKAYTYEIGPENFKEDGVYTVTVYSEDRASNHSSNGVKEKEIVFAVDTAPPSVVVTGVEDQARYYDTGRTVTIDASDNLALVRVEVWLDGEPVHIFNQEELAASDGIVEVSLHSLDDWQTLYVKAADAAGNEAVSDSRTFLITKNLLIQWYRRPWLFWGSMAALFGLAAAMLRRQAGKSIFSENMVDKRR